VKGRDVRDILDLISAISERPLRDWGSYIEDILKEIVRVTNSTSASIWVYEEGSLSFSCNWLYSLVRDKKILDMKGRSVAFGKDIIGSVAYRGVPEIVRDVAADKRNEALHWSPFKELILLPMKLGGEEVGVMAVGTTAEDRGYGDEDLAVLQTVSVPISLMLKAMALQEGIKATFQGMIVSFTFLMELKMPYMAGHSERVALLSDLLSEALGWSKEKRTNLYAAALMHDVGMLALPDSIIGFEGKFNDEQRKMMMRHTIIGEKMVEQGRHAEEIRKVIRSHHERWDGKGYPDGLREDEIPIEARIVAIADTMDALTARRPYRSPLSEEQALRVIEDNAGTQFDPELAHTFVAAYMRRMETVSEKKEEEVMPVQFSRVTILAGDRIVDGRVLDLEERALVIEVKDPMADMDIPILSSACLLFSRRGAVYSLEGRVTSVDQKSRIAKFEHSGISQRHERKRYVKVSAIIDGYVVPVPLGTIYGPEELWKSFNSYKFSAYIVEVGGGGAKFVPNPRKDEVVPKMTVGNKVLMRFEMKGIQFLMLGRIIGTPWLTMEESYEVEFEEGQDAMRDRLIGAIFAKQMDLRRKGLI
jgi:HD-GYP domain-containing protein (c-di-GMP phosphodiesterase class II)